MTNIYRDITFKFEVTDDDKKMIDLSIRDVDEENTIKASEFPQATSGKDVFWIAGGIRECGEDITKEASKLPQAESGEGVYYEAREILRANIKSSIIKKMYNTN